MCATGRRSRRGSLFHSSPSKTSPHLDGPEGRRGNSSARRQILMSSSPKLVRARLTGVATALLTAMLAHSAAGQVPVRLTLDDLMSRIQNEHPVNRQSLANVNAAVARAAELG